MRDEHSRIIRRFNCKNQESSAGTMIENMIKQEPKRLCLEVPALDISLDMHTLRLKYNVQEQQEEKWAHIVLVASVTRNKKSTSATFTNGEKQTNKQTQK